MLRAAALAALAAVATAQGCGGFGTTWGPGIGPPPAGCGGGGGGGGVPAPAAGSSSAHAAPLLGDVGRTTATGTDARSGAYFAAGENIYGPFEAGFSAQQNFILEGLGCADGNAGHVVGGIDTHTAEQMVAHQCGITLPRVEGDRYISLIDECGGHTHEYHFHERLSCLYDGSAPGHSAQVGEAADGQPLYGEFEQAGERPLLDACGGHYGATPESGGAEVYHYHVQGAPPFTVGCFGPNDDGSLVTVQQCRDFYTGCGDGDVVPVTTPAGTKDYDLWCPCFDAAGSNTGDDIQRLAVFVFDVQDAAATGGGAAATGSAGTASAAAAGGGAAATGSAGTATAATTTAATAPATEPIATATEPIATATGPAGTEGTAAGGGATTSAPAAAAAAAAAGAAGAALVATAAVLVVLAVLAVGALLRSRKPCRCHPAELPDESAVVTPPAAGQTNPTVFAV